MICEWDLAVFWGVECFVLVIAGLGGWVGIRVLGFTCTGVLWLLELLFRFGVLGLLGGFRGLTLDFGCCGGLI